MSGISSGVGILSGINSAQLIEQLIQIEAAPRKLLEARVTAIDAKRTAFLELSAKILGIKSAASQFNKLDFFKRFSANSTDESTLLATASGEAVPGSYTFRVHSLVTNHSLLSRGFANPDSEPVGAGELTIEVGKGKVNRATDLSTLRGGAGVRRGVISITDRTGAKAEVDLSTAVTVDDILTAINSNTAINVRARVSGVDSNGATGDRIVIEDTSGGTGNLVIADRPGGFTATDLGILVNGAVGRVDGDDLVRLTDTTPLSLLNDGNGIGRLLNGTDLTFETSFGNFNVSLTDFLNPDTSLSVLNSGVGVRTGTVRITDRSGQSADIDLSTAVTVREVIDAINATDLNISAAIVNSHIQITDTSEVGENSISELKIEDLTGYTAADLGIAESTEESAIFGRDVYRVKTVGDLVRAINAAPGNNSFVEAAISEDGNGLTLNAYGLGNHVSVSAGSGSTAAEDLGIAGLEFDAGNSIDTRPLISGLNTVLLSSLKGGDGVNLGTIRFTDRANQTSAIDFSDARTLQDVIDLINADETVGITASVNAAGNGLLIRDESNGNNPSITIQDVTGSLAADLGIVADSIEVTNDGIVNGQNLQLEYVTRQTLLSDLNGGRGVALGDFKITDKSGSVFEIELPANLTTVGQVIDVISQVTPDTIVARINDNGDGIIVEDTSGGALPLKIEDVSGGQTAANLRLAGTSKPGKNFIDGSYETKIEIAAGDTLNDVVAKINSAKGSFSASILNDQGTVNPYRLTLSSTSAGRAGELIVDGAALGFSFTTLSAARDSVVTVGSADAAEGVLIATKSNKIENIVPGVTLDLLSPSDDPVTINVAQDVDGIVDDVREFVDAYNELQGTIDDDIAYNADTEARGPLLGEPTVNVIRNRMHNVVQSAFDGVAGSLSRLSGLGISLGPNNRLQFNEERFREVYDASPQQVEQIFTTTDLGFGDKLLDTVDELTRDFDGVLTRQDDLLADQQELLNDQIANMNLLLNAKRARLQAQFVSLERTLAFLQDQQTSLATIAQLASGSA